MSKEEAINDLIKDCDTNKISDGYHTFGELYEHRIVLWVAYCKLWEETKSQSKWKTTEGRQFFTWRSVMHSDGSSFDGWFVLGLLTEDKKQLTYHLPVRYWDECDFAKILDKSPEFDGHTSADVLDRIKSL